VPVGAVEIAEDERRVAHEVEGEQAPGGPVSAQRGDGACIEVDDPGLAGLRWAFDQLLAGALVLHHPDAAADCEAAGVQTDVAPAKSECLTPAQELPRLRLTLWCAR
jgi:hypothetical protein